MSHVHADVFGFVSFHPANALWVLSCSLRSGQRAQWEPQAFPFKSTFLDEIRLHSTAFSTQCLLQLSVPLPCLFVVEITSCRASLEQRGATCDRFDTHQTSFLLEWTFMHYQCFLSGTTGPKLLNKYSSFFFFLLSFRAIIQRFMILFQFKKCFAHMTFSGPNPLCFSYIWV